MKHWHENDEEKSEILVATRTQNYQDENDSDLMVSKKTALVKKALSEVVAKAA